MRSLLVLVLLLAPAGACLWDQDTLATERAGLPSVYDAVFGLYPRHTAEFYTTRVARLRAGELTAETSDGLAVALLRLGRTKEALAVLNEKETRWPDQFTTLANRAACLVASGDLAAAAVALEQAVQRQPERAERERLQLLAVRFQMAVERDPRLAERRTMLGDDFAERLGDTFRLAAPRGADDRARQTAERHLQQRLDLPTTIVDSLVGLLVIGQQDPPEVYFVLAELLAARGDRLLAWHAYQRALDLGHPRTATIALAQHQLRQGVSREQIDELREPPHYRRRRQALAWGDAYAAWERRLLAAGGDPSDPARLAEFLKEHPTP